MVKVLIVEDNELNLKLFNDLISIKQYEVITSNDGVNIMNIVLTEKPDLILMDIQLSGISGIDLIKELKGSPETQKIPIIAITAFAMKNDEIEISKSGCDMYLSKPVAVDKFIKSIDHFIKPNVDIT